MGTPNSSAISTPKLNSASATTTHLGAAAAPSSSFCTISFTSGVAVAAKEPNNSVTPRGCSSGSPSEIYSNLISPAAWWLNWDSRSEKPEKAFRAWTVITKVTLRWASQKIWAKLSMEWM
nr:hypothetical protein Itr_chr08CG05160 [Ipomoea trifida]